MTGVQEREKGLKFIDMNVIDLMQSCLYSINEAGGRLSRTYFVE